MNLDTLEKLADAASTFVFDKNGKPIKEKQVIVSPATIKSLIALCRMQQEALELVKSYEKSFDDPYESACEALAAFERFNGETDDTYT